MASGSFCNNVGQNCNLIISWNSVKGQGGSTVNATLIAQNRNGWYFDAVVYGYGITINGSQVTGTGARLSASSNGSAGLISHSVWVPYTGDKSITISGYANFNGIINLSNQSISGTVALDKIGSAPTMGSVTAPTTSTVSEKTTSITVRWNKATSYNNSVTYAIGCSINGGSYEWRYPDNNINTTSYTWDIGTPTQGATYQFAVCCANDIARSDYKYSGTVTINKLSPPTIGDLPSPFNPYSSTTFTIPLTGGSQTNGESFMRRSDVYMDNTNGQQVKWYCGSPSYGNTSIGVTVPQAEIINALGTGRYSANIYVIAWIENSNGTRSGYTVKGTTVNINTDGGATPTLSPPTISGGAFNNAATCFIAGISTLNVSSPAASLRRAPSGTTISYKIACTGATTQNSQNANFSGLTAGTKTITVTATDSRGLSVSVSKQVVVQSYAAPTIRAFTAIRLDDPNTSAKLVYTLAYSPIYQYTDVDTKGNQLNGISLQQYKKDNFDWNTASNELVLTNLETDSTYTIQLRIADKVNTTTYVTATQVIPTIKTTMAWRSWGVGIGCIPQTSYALEVNGSSKISGSLDASNMLQVNSNGVAIGKTSEKSAFEVNMDSYFYNDLQVKHDINCASLVVNNGVKCDGIKSGSIIRYGNHFWEFENTPLWIKLGTWMNSADSETCKITVRTGEGYNANTNQNTEIEIFIKNSWQNSLSATGAFGGTFIVKYNYNYSISVQLMAQSHDVCDVWVRIPFPYGNGDYSFEGPGDWLHSIESRPFDSNPTSGVMQNCKEMTADFKGYPVGSIYLTWDNNNPQNFMGGTWVRMAEGRGLFGIGYSTDKDGLKEQVGEHEESGSWKHTLAKNEEHMFNDAGNGQYIGAWVSYNWGNSPNKTNIIRPEWNPQSFWTMPPYIGIYVWRRTA